MRSLCRRKEKVTIIPFYGGAKGQALQIVESVDGQVTTTVIKMPENFSESTEDTINTAELENPPLPSKYELDEFGNYIRSIQNTALRVIKLQEVAKKNGKLTEDQEAIYKESMENLNQSAKNLAKLQDESNPLGFESREGLSAWFERKQSNNKKDKDKNKRKEEEDKKKKEEERKRKEEEEKKKLEESIKKEEERRKEEEERKKEEEKRKEDEEKQKEEEEDDDDDDSITINLPPEDASVAEAKPVGLAVAGEGGVAASKPIATAVVGPGGLAIARPVGTAIAGVSPDQALAPIYGQAYLPGTKPKTSSSINKQESASEYINRLISKYHQN